MFLSLLRLSGNSANYLSSPLSYQDKVEKTFSQGSMKYCPSGAGVPTDLLFTYLTELLSDSSRQKAPFQHYIFLCSVAEQRSI